ncbi:hypothetical protein HX004_14465 [Myroides sp. 1354]|uniref:hypothetical protein n=1 Tax=unclassified Myroides TaxID=2642485 RepID=UPI002578D6DB|nr:MULTISPECIES: hypothetical protein [unclassified Myroides]MDM1046030.1 hypothetical protein [Myroides sp. R163-1]MDM1056966.1 hypothetical protein [Myroides sp. 1354]MDM1070161.1 hypothetical protein [Myroides sp. 1372]
MDKETAHYIVTYFFNLLPYKEKLAWKHYASILKLECNENPKAMEMYKSKGWITDDQEILALLKKGYETFEIETAKKIVTRYPTQIFFNTCPKCSKLARTPHAKQCRFCKYTWHNDREL